MGSARKGIMNLQLIFLLLATEGCVVLCLRLLGVDVPPAAMVGEPVWLNCSLDLESDDLYSVKWYKNDVEFYRYLPRDNPKGQKYDLPGVDLDLGRSRQGNVFLRTVDLQTEGLYRCEASAESPTFQTVEGEKTIKVYVLPKGAPSILGSQPRYEVGDSVNVTCMSGPSRPAATLKWYINGKEASPIVERAHLPQDHLNGLFTSSRGLLFVVQSQDLHSGGAITLRCEATVSQTYSTASEELVVVGGDHLDAQAAASSPSFVSRDGPIITGSQPQYRVGDLLDVNCSSTAYPRPQLQWYLNDKEVESGEVRFSGAPGVLGLRFKVLPQHLDANEEMRLKCTATLSRVIHTRSEEATLGGGNHRTSGLTVTADNFGKVSDRSGGTTLQSLALIAHILIIFML